MHPLTVTSWFTSWTADFFAILLSLLLVGGFAWLWRRAAAQGVRWPRWRVTAYLVLGVGSLIYATCGVIGAYRTSLLWCFATQIAVLSSVTPVGLALGDPVGLWETATGRSATWLRGRVARALMSPGVSSVLTVVSILLVFFTPYGDAAARSTWISALLQLHMLIVGTLVVLPLLSADLLPTWATPATRTFLAFVDGLLDAIPGIVVMTATGLLLPRFPGYGTSAHGSMSAELDQKFAGGALLVVAELIGLPMLAAVFVDWLRADRAEASTIDAQLDTAASTQDQLSDQPWWLTDERLKDRFRGR